MAHLTLTQRQQIETGIRQGLSNARVAQQIGVHPSTVGRELKRNALDREAYDARHAHTMAAATQIAAARKRFPVIEHFCKPVSLANHRPYKAQTGLSLCTPYAEYSLPAPYYMRMGVRLFLNFCPFARHYVCERSRMFDFTRLFKPPALFRPNGKPIFPPFSRWDSRGWRECRPNGLNSLHYHMAGGKLSTHSSTSSSKPEFLLPFSLASKQTRNCYAQPSTNTLATMRGSYRKPANGKKTPQKNIGRSHALSAQP